MYRPNGWSVTNGYKLVTISETRAGYDVRARMMGVKNLAVRVFPEGRVCVATVFPLVGPARLQTSHDQSLIKSQCKKDCSPRSAFCDKIDCGIELKI